VSAICTHSSPWAIAEECVQIALTPFDRQMGHLIVGSAHLLMGQIAQGFATIKRHRDESLANGWHYTALGTEVPFGVGMVLSGEFKRGVRWLEGVIDRAETQYRYQFYAEFARLHLAEVYLALLQSKKRPPLRFVLKNPFFLLRARRSAGRKAAALLDAVSRNRHISAEGIIQARVDFDIAQLYKAARMPDLTRKHLQQARIVASRQNAIALIAKIDAVMASL